MARNMSLINHPIIEPGVCGKCGSQTSSWFLDLGFDTVFNYKDDFDNVTWCDGVVYLCAECCNSLFEDLYMLYNQYKRDEARELVPLKMIPITIDKKEEVDGDSGPSVADDSGEPIGIDESFESDESDDESAARGFTVSFAQAV